MTTAAANSHHADGPLALIAQFRLFSALAVAGAIFWSLGYLVLGHVDPRGPICMVTFSAAHRITTFATLALLAAAAGGLAAVIAGRQASIISPMAVGVGLAALNLRGGSANLLAAYVLPAGAGGPTWPAFSFMIEMWMWLALVVVGGAVGHWVAVRLVTPGAGDAEAEAAAHADGNELAKSATAVLLASPLAYALIMILGGSATDAVLKPQIYFSVGAGFGIATFAGQYVFRARWVWWPLVVVGIVAAVAYVFGQPTFAPGTANYALRVLPNVVSRPLPIEYAGMGAVGAMVGVFMAAPASHAIRQVTQSA